MSGPAGGVSSGSCQSILRLSWVVYSFVVANTSIIARRPATQDPITIRLPGRAGGSITARYQVHFIFLPGVSLSHNRRERVVKAKS
jgi:hypothetical protein